MKKDEAVTSDNQAMMALKQHGGNIVTVILLVLAVFFGWQFYQKNYAKIDTVAADSYTAISTGNDQLVLLAQNPQTATQAADAQKALFAQIDKLVAEHGETVYAWEALMIKARHQADGNDYKSAEQTLLQASGLPIADEGLLAISRLQLAQTQLATGDDAKALATIEGVFPESFEASRLEILGDIKVATKDNEAAKTAYQKAWELLSDRQENRALLSIKMQALGMTPSPIDVPAVVAQAPSTPAIANADETAKPAGDGTDSQTADTETVDNQAKSDDKAK